MQCPKWIAHKNVSRREFTTKKVVIATALCILAFGMGQTGFAEQQVDHSHGETTFYGVYEAPSDPHDPNQPNEPKPSEKPAGGITGNGSSSQVSSGTISPNYSPAGKPIIPRAGDQNYPAMQTFGMSLVFLVGLYLWIQNRRKEENQE